MPICPKMGQLQKDKVDKNNTRCWKTTFVALGTFFMTKIRDPRNFGDDRNFCAFLQKLLSLGWKAKK